MIHVTTNQRAIAGIAATLARRCITVTTVTPTLSQEDEESLRACIRQELANEAAPLEDYHNTATKPAQYLEDVMEDANPITQEDVDIATQGLHFIRASRINTPASLEDYNDEHGRRYATRTAPELLNWQESMSVIELQQAGLTANRQTMPGDWDHVSIPGRPEPLLYDA